MRAALLVLLPFAACAVPPSETTLAANESPSVSSSVPGEPAARTVTLAEGRFAYGDRTIDFPATIESLTNLLGPPSRTVESGNTIDVWDDLGISSRRKVGELLVTEINIAVSRDSRSFRPTSPFLGKVRLPGGNLGPHATTGDLRAVGLCAVGSSELLWQRRMKRFGLFATWDEGLVEVALAWRGPDPQHVTGPPLAEDQLFTADSRDYGFPMDMTLREVWHSGNLSTVHVEGTGRNVGPGMFLIGTLGEIARRRGYEFFVLPEQRGGAEFAVGFLHDEDALLEREFPDEPDLWSPCDVHPHDFIFDALGSWPDGGRQEPRAEAEVPQPR